MNPPNQPNATKVRQNVKTRSVTILATIITALVAFTSASDALAQGETWTATGSLNTARRVPTASLLSNGMVLVAGGFGNSVFLTSAELYDPASGTWTATGSLNTGRDLHTATLLPNGTVLVAGGVGNHLLNIAELYDPASGTWAATGSLNSGRFLHTATLLPNGMVLVAGGLDNDNSVLNSAELYDPASGTWTATGSLNVGRHFHTASLLPNGMVLVAGGSDDNGWPFTSVELYDPASGTWTATGSLNTARVWHTASLLPNGTVLVAGGWGNSGLLNSAELYAVTSPSYSAQVQQPINADGTSVFNVRRGVVPVKFTLTQGGVATCALPPATIAVTRTAGGTTGPIDESIYTGSADTGSNFRIDNCHYIYNLSASALGVGTYRVDININGQVVGSASFQLK